MLKNFKITNLFFALIFLASFQTMSAANISLENNISATANTGGNKIEGEGKIKIGSASSSVKVENKISGSEEKIEIKTEVQAKANNQEAEIRTAGNDSVSIEKENGGAKVKVEIETSGEPDKAEHIADEIKEIDESANQETGVVARVIKKIKLFFENIF